MATTVVLLCGLPGSGKSTLIEKVKGSLPEELSLKVVCYDDMWEHVTSFQPDAWKQNRLVLFDRVATYLKDDTHPIDVIVVDDNMFYRSMRKKYHRLCRACKYL